MAKHEVGVFKHVKSTSNFEVFQRENETWHRKESQYVPKEAFNGETVPATIRLVVEFENDADV